ncbi:MAG TPA: Fe-S cluster assembly protein SufD [Gammaproteobacteria bacterium]|nr:Fe-S cluster assembly protein SufD [Gammaproteobacteria bacterium]
MSASAVTEHFLAAFERLAPLLPGAAAPAVLEARRVALARFARLGMPTARTEAWRYSTHGNWLRQPLDPAPVVATTAALPGELTPGNLAATGLGAHARILFVDGRRVDEQGTRALPPGLRLHPLSRLLEEDTDLARPWLVAAVEAANDGPAALNLAFFSEGALIEVDREAGDVTIELLFVSTAAGVGHTAHTHLCMEIADGAHATVVERHVSLGGVESAAGADVSRQLHVGSRARLTHAVLQDAHPRLYHLQRTLAKVGADAELSLWSLALGGNLARYEATVDLIGRGASVDLAGVYSLSGRQAADHHLTVRHLTPNTRSQMRFRGLLDGHSRGAFTGCVQVAPGADGASARQANDNLLLSPHAEAVSRPELGIETDDVQCSHGSTVGQQDESAVFYLRSRGIDEAMARSLLSSAFAIEILRTMPHDGARTLALAMLSLHLPQRLALEEML